MSHHVDECINEEQLTVFLFVVIFTPLVLILVNLYLEHQRKGTMSKVLEEMLKLEKMYRFEGREQPSRANRRLILEQQKYYLQEQERIIQQRLEYLDMDMDN